MMKGISYRGLMLILMIAIPHDLEIQDSENDDDRSWFCWEKIIGGL